jgi:hypothetical protein
MIKNVVVIVIAGLILYRLTKMGQRRGASKCGQTTERGNVGTGTGVHQSATFGDYSGR